MVFEMPPISPDFSSMMGLISVRFNNSYAAVRPAGPAPIMIAFLPIVSLFFNRKTIDLRLNNAYWFGSSSKLQLKKKDFSTINQEILTISFIHICEIL